MKNPDIAVIINSFNRLNLLKDCLGALNLWYSKSPFSERLAIVIYDAGSNDGTLEWLQKTKPEFDFPIHVIIPKSGDDTSFAAGINKGVFYAEESFPDLRYLLFYETDNQILNSKALENALTLLENRPKLGACGFTVRKTNGEPAGVGMPFPTLVNFALGKNFVYRFKLEDIRYKWDNSTENIEFSPVDVVYTSPLLVKLKAWKASGGLDEKMFPFSDCDIDWAIRLRKLGWSMGVVRSDAVIHDNQETLSNWSKSRAMQFHRGRLRYFKRHNPISVYFVWPTFLLARHAIELALSKAFIKEPERRNQLSGQFSNLLKSSLKNYE